MARYQIIVPVVFHEIYEVEADNEEKAWDKVHHKRICHEAPIRTVSSHTGDTEEWRIKKISGE